jgi:hypothetical protein
MTSLTRRKLLLVNGCQYLHLPACSIHVDSLSVIRVRNLLHRSHERYPHETAYQITEEYLTRTAQHARHGSAATLLAIRLVLPQGGFGSAVTRAKRESADRLEADGVSDS